MGKKNSYDFSKEGFKWLYLDAYTLIYQWVGYRSHLP